MLAPLLADFQLPGIPATLGLAAIALIGYLVGRQSRTAKTAAGQSSQDLDRALADARQLENITEEMLSATRDALDQCRQLRQRRPPRKAASTVDGTC